jgi:DNA-binding NarL/FixJ family response regulator
VDIMLAAGLVEDARRYASEFSTIAAAFHNPAVQAMAAYATASVALASGNGEEALGQARESTRVWNEIGSPYEAARARVLVARALRELGDEESATGEFAVARRTLADVGAAPAVDDVDRLLDRPRPGGLTEREVQVLRLVAAGRSNHDIARDLVLSQKTVERHLSNIFTKLDVPSRTAAAAYAHEHGLMS